MTAMAPIRSNVCGQTALRRGQRGPKHEFVASWHACPFFVVQQPRRGDRLQTSRLAYCRSKQSLQKRRHNPAYLLSPMTHRAYKYSNPVFVFLSSICIRMIFDSLLVAPPSGVGFKKAVQRT